MNKRTLLCAVGVLLAALVWLARPAPIRADGILIPVPPDRWPPETPMENLAIKYHRVTVTIEDQVATIEVDQVFVNTTDFEIEGIYMFPLPEGASISQFAMYVDGEKLEGALLDRDEAREIYEGIVRRQRDPALLEYVGRNAFRARIYPIPPRGEKRVVLRYSELLRGDNGLVRYLYPLATERFSSKPIEDVSIHVEIRSQAALRAIYSPSHQVAVYRDGDHKAEVGYEERDTKPDRDFELYYSTAESELGLSILSHKRPGEDGFFLLLVAPPVQQEQAVVAKDVVIVLDVSGSMRGAKIEQAKDALYYILDHLNAEDRFNIISFSTGTRRYSRPLAEANPTELKYARQFVEGMVAGGGTNIDRALQEALEMGGTERPQVVIFLTDGLATEGVVETGQIIRNVAQVAPEATRLFAFGIGDEVNTTLLDTIAQEHRGASAYVRPHQSIAEEVSAFYAKIGTPVLADVELDFRDLLVEETYPQPLPDLFAGTQLVVVGRYRRGGTTTLTLRGQVNDQEQVFVYRDLALADQGGPDFIPRLWATRKIGYLLTQMRLHGEKQELIEEVIDLSLRYGIMTPYTSFLVNETEDILTREGRQEAEKVVRETVVVQREAPVGGAAVERSQAQYDLYKSEQVQAPSAEQVKQVGTRAFVQRGEVWVDTGYDPDTMKPLNVEFGSQTYFDLLTRYPEAGQYLAAGQQVIVMLEGQAYQVVPEGQPSDPQPPAKATPRPTPLGTRDPAPRLNPFQRFWGWLQSLFE